MKARDILSLEGSQYSNQFINKADQVSSVIAVDDYHLAEFDQELVDQSSS